MSKFKVPNVEEISDREIPKNVKLFTLKDVDILKSEIQNTTDYKMISDENSPNKLWQKIRGEGSGQITDKDIVYDQDAANTTYLRYKYCCDFEVDMDVFVATMRDYTFRHEWDDRDIGRQLLAFYKCDDIPDAIPHQLIEHYVKRGQYVVASREFVTLSTEVWEDENTMYSLGRNAEIPDVAPLDKSAVRSVILYLGMCIQKIDEKTVRYWCVTQTDPKGWLPAWVVNWACQKLPLEFQNNMTRACAIRRQKYPNGKEYQNYYQIRGKQCRKGDKIEFTKC